MLRLFSVLLVFGLACLIGSSAASAQDKEKKPRKTAEERFADLDKDKSGDLDEEEFIAPVKDRGEEAVKRMKEAFKKADKDSNKKVSKDEYKAWVEQFRGKKGKKEKKEEK